MIKIKFNGEQIVAGNTLKDGSYGFHYNVVTEDAIQAAIQYILRMKMHSDNSQELEFENPFTKRDGFNYKVSIKIDRV